MPTTIERLLVLQERDRRIARLQQESEDVPKRREQIEQSIEREKQAVADAEERFKHQQAKVKQVELDIEAHREEINRFRQQQFQVKNNDEYRALEHEISATEKKIRALEDTELALMEEMEQTKFFVAEKEAELQHGEDQVKSDIDNLNQRLSNIQTELKDLEANRGDLAQDIDEEWLSKYERILAHTKNVAIVNVENSGCGGCHMKIPPQVIHDARKADLMVPCPYCGRLLCWQP